MSELKANELRCGNLINYLTAEGDNLETTIDWQDLKWVTEDPNGFNYVHLPIPLTEEWLVKLGFEKFDDDGYSIKVDNATLIIDIEDFSIGVFHSEYDYNKGLYFTPNKCFRTVHQLQNLFFSLTETELTIKD
jgi:hypothetical protein